MNNLQTILDGVAKAIVLGSKGAVMAFIEAGEGLLNKIAKPLAEKAMTGIETKLSSVESQRWQAMLWTFVDAGVIQNEDAKNFYKLKDSAHPYDWILFLVITLKLFFGYITLKSEGTMAKQSQALNKELRPYLPSYGDVIGAAFVAPEKTGRVKEIMKRTGITDEDIDLIFLSRYRLYSEETIKDLFLRGIIDKQTMVVRMRELGYTDTRINEMIQAWEIIPSPQDLFWMVGKEAFEPDMIKHIGLGDEFPQEQVKWLEKQGISAEWARKYWYAHWDEPSIQMGYEMLHRGVINDAELDMLFRAIEMPPFWREKLKEISYRVLSRVDVRRMHKIGVLTDDELIQTYMDQGYNKDNATKMAQFTVLYNQSHSTGVTKAQVIQSYKTDMVTRTDASDLLQTLGIDEDHAEFLLYLEDYKKDQEYSEKRIKNIGDKYKLGVINNLEVRNQLGKLNIPARRTELLIETWEIDKFEDTAIPSKTDLDKFFRNKIINDDEYKAEMRKLGYTTTAIGWYYKSVKLTMEKK